MDRLPSTYFLIDAPAIAAGTTAAKDCPSLRLNAKAMMFFPTKQSAVEVQLNRAAEEGSMHDSGAHHHSHDHGDHQDQAHDHDHSHQESK